jgi:phosphate transport system substrate-binding protein
MNGRAPNSPATGSQTSVCQKLQPNWAIESRDSLISASPIASFTWVLLYEDPQDKAQAAMMKEFMRWALTDGQKMAPELGYASLPPQVVDMEMKALEQLKVQ